MFTYTSTFSSFSVDDVQKAKEFYETVLGVRAVKTIMGLELHVKGNESIFVYQKDDHVPATFTVLNFTVEDIDIAVDELRALGVLFEQYQGQMQTDEKGIMRGGNDGPTMAWFRDPAGNFLSVIEG
jgi:catechol 2,3-dioxygenase-like lactoylglutathione lyase family enzyme